MNTNRAKVFFMILLVASNGMHASDSNGWATFFAKKTGLNFYYSPFESEFWSKNRKIQEDLTWRNDRIESRLAEFNEFHTTLRNCPNEKVRTSEEVAALKIFAAWKLKSVRESQSAVEYINTRYKPNSLNKGYALTGLSAMFGIGALACKDKDTSKALLGGALVPGATAIRAYISDYKHADKVVSKALKKWPKDKITANQKVESEQSQKSYKPNSLYRGYALTGLSAMFGIGALACKDKETSKVLLGGALVSGAAAIPAYISDYKHADKIVSKASKKWPRGEV